MQKKVVDEGESKADLTPYILDPLHTDPSHITPCNAHIVGKKGSLTAKKTALFVLFVLYF